MKLKLALISAVAVAGFAAPAYAQDNGNAIGNVVGELSSVTGDVYIQRGGEDFRAQEKSALMRGDKIVTKGDSSARINIREIDGDLRCDHFVDSMRTAMIPQSDFCGSLAGIKADASVGMTAGSTAGTSSSGTIIAVGGALAAAALIYAVTHDDDDTPASP